jgi:A/G-specific adenine glycosylase
VRQFRAIIRDYYAKHARPMPWRETRDPYRIVISEVMLQQTQVPRVIEKYRAFIKRFPTVRKLADAPLRDVLAAWQGLGYNRRALALKRLAAEVVERHDGRIPADRDELRALPGIGEATSGSILAFAFNKPVVFIETNIRSVYIHHFFKDRAGVKDDELIPYIEKTLDREDPREWYYALMDYGVYLKSQMPNPSRKSSHYKKQSRFEGSDRELRGRILRILTAHGRIQEPVLLKKLASDRQKAGRILRALQNEGLITKRGNYFAIDDIIS